MKLVLLFAFQVIDLKLSLLLTVEVNQRALIDKILARYSGEHTGRSPPFPYTTEHLPPYTQCLENFCRFGTSPACATPVQLMQSDRTRTTPVQQT